MMDEAEKLVKLEKAVMKDTSKQIDEIMQEAEASRVKMLEKANDLSLYDAYNIIREEIKKISGKYLKLVSKAELDSKKQILLYREQLAEKAFNNVSEMLVKYTATDEYKAFISKVLKDGITNKNEAIVYTSEKDKQMVTDLVNEMSATAKVVVKNAIKIGGVCIGYENSNVLNDKTIDTALSDEREAFTNSNCFKIC